MMDHLAMEVYARVCGWTPARAHARSGDRFAIATHLGSGRTFTRAMQEFAVLYADQNQRDYEAFLRAIVEGRIPRSDVADPKADRGA
jgi:cytochrome P450